MNFWKNSKQPLIFGPKQGFLHISASDAHKNLSTWTNLVMGGSKSSCEIKQRGPWFSEQPPLSTFQGDNSPEDTSTGPSTHQLIRAATESPLSVTRRNEMFSLADSQKRADRADQKVQNLLSQRKF